MFHCALSAAPRCGRSGHGRIDCESGCQAGGCRGEGRGRPRKPGGSSGKEGLRGGRGRIRLRQADPEHRFQPHLAAVTRQGPGGGVHAALPAACRGHLPIPEHPCAPQVDLRRRRLHQPGGGGPAQTGQPGLRDHHRGASRTSPGHHAGRRAVPAGGKISDRKRVPAPNGEEGGRHPGQRPGVVRHAGVGGRDRR